MKRGMAYKYLDNISRERFSMDELDYERALLVPQGLDAATTRKALEALRLAISAIAESEFDAVHVGRAILSVARELEVETEPFAVAFCVAVTGRRKMAKLSEAMQALGKQGVLRRIEQAVGKLSVVA